MAGEELITLLLESGRQLVGPISFGSDTSLFIGISANGLEWQATLTEGVSPILAPLLPGGAAQGIEEDDNQIRKVLASFRVISELSTALTELPAIDFWPPERTALSIETGPVAGGGFLAWDEDAGEYVGALELKFSSWGIKAIGVLSTKLPDERPGLSLMLLVFADLPRFHIAFNIFFEGIGGAIGLQRRADTDAIKAGMSTGIFDDLLFPPNPIADAPRIIKRIQTVFPIERNAFLIGPMLRLTWSTPAVGELKMGVILALENLFGGPGPAALARILFLGQLRIGLPEAQNDQVVRIICDMFGELDFSDNRIHFEAHLRDSRMAGGLELAGDLIFRMDYGDRPTYLLSVGGYHPGFTDIPSQGVGTLKRIALGFKIGPVVVTASGYLAVTSATVQFGADIRAKAKLGPVSIDGSINFDALIYYKPSFRFEIDYRIGFTVKFKGRTLTSVDVVGTLSGPGLWHITGRLKFSVLWWDITKSFDAKWGSLPRIDVPILQLNSLLAAAFANSDNWNAALPAGVDALVTLGTRPEDAADNVLIAHPGSQMRFSQSEVPLNLEIEKVGESPVGASRRYTLEEVTIGGPAAGAATIIPEADRELTQEYLARGTYVTLSEEDRLAKPSFEPFDVGVAFGSSDYSVPEGAIEVANLDYDTSILTPRKGAEISGSTRPSQILDTQISVSVLTVQAKAGGAAGAKLRKKDRLRNQNSNKILLGEPLLAIVGIDTLDQEDDLQGLAATNTLLAEQQIGDGARASKQIVELFELEAFGDA